MHDAIVVGGGPAGLYAATLMAEGGLDVLVLEEDAAIGVPTHCTGIVSAEVYDLYKIPEHTLLERVSRCVLLSPGQVRAEFESPGEEIAVLDRAAFDQALTVTAEKAGATVVTGCRVDAIQNGRDAVDVSTAAGRSVRARSVVLACGVTYRFHGLLGSRPPALVLHTAQLELDAEPADALEIHLGRNVAPDGFAWLVPIRRGARARIKAGVLMRGDARAHLQAFIERPTVAGRLREPAGDPIRRILPLQPVRRSFGERIIAVGDAAGLTKPVTGGGIFYSLLSAAMAAQTLTEALCEDDLRAERLSRYEARWRQRLMPEIRAGRWFRHLLANLPDHQLDRFVEAVASDDVRAVIAQSARFNWHRAVIMAILRRPGIKAILLRSLFR